MMVGARPLGSSDAFNKTCQPVPNTMCLTLLIFCLFCGIGVQSENSDTSVVSGCPQQSLTPVYKSLGCVPLKENGAECPTSYDCSSYEARDPKKCHTATKSFNIAESVDDAVCQVACFCSENHRTKGGRPNIVCAAVDCPWGQPLGEGCRYKYKRDTCCPSVDCDKNEEKITCTYENRTLQEGETFEPSSDPCTTCTCQKGFRGLIEEPYCQPQNCDTHVHYNGAERLNDGCVPIFYGTKRCCPISWKCPEDSDTVVKAISKSQVKTAATCRFGKNILQPGDVLQQSDSDVQCSCDLPPFLTCTQKEVPYPYSN